MIKVRTKVVTVDGATHTSAASQTGTREDLAAVENVLREFKSLNYLSLDYEDGSKAFFNPRHVISVTLIVQECES